MVASKVVLSNMPKKYGYLWSYQQLKYSRNVQRLYSSTERNLKLIKDSKRNVDTIGPPDPVSNLRPIVFAKSDRETAIEREYRLARQKTQDWNQQFWSEHNAKFSSERKRFQKTHETEKNQALTADEMSVFYKNFLDKNWRTHLNYNLSWYRQNLNILYLEFRVRLSKFKFK